MTDPNSASALIEALRQQASDKLMPLAAKGLTYQVDRHFDCPHCKRRQVVKPLVAAVNACDIEILQCLGCRELQVGIVPHRGSDPANQRITAITIHPKERLRPPKPFRYLPSEVGEAYVQACDLIGVHAGAAGAYARRALEVILDGMGYHAKTLLQSLERARAETDPDRRLPRRILDRLDYVKEVGNFALHVRRNRELAIIEMSDVEAGACLQIVEELMTFVFEEPGAAQAQATQLNKQLQAASRPEIPTSDAEPLWSATAVAEANAADVESKEDRL